MTSVGKGSKNTITKLDMSSRNYISKTYTGCIVMSNSHGMASFDGISLIREGTKVTFNGKVATVPRDKVIYVTDNKILMADDEPVVFDS